MTKWMYPVLQRVGFDDMGNKRVHSLVQWYTSMWICVVAFLFLVHTLQLASAS